MKIKTLALSLVLLFCGCLLVGCADTIYYENFDKYEIGSADAVDGFDNISIDWSSGEVNLIFADVDTVSLKEESTDALTDEMQMRWLVEDGTLKIRFSGVGLFTAARLSNVHKTLTVTLPFDYALSRLDIALSSADLHTDELHAESVKIASSSGDIDLSVSDGKTADISTSSGSVTAKLSSVSSLDFSSSSGAVTAEIGSCDLCSVSTSSGDVNLTVGTVGILNAESSSGSIHADVNAVNTADVSASSGSVFLNLPENLDFTLNETTGSGHFDCDFPIVTKGNRHVHGKGTAQIDLCTSSGNIVVRKK